MNLKKLVAALLVVAAFSAVPVSSAHAVAVTESADWYTGASPGTKVTGSLAVSAELSGVATFLASASDQEIVIHATDQLHDQQQSSPRWRLRPMIFNGITVQKPACNTASTVTSKPLTMAADWMSGATDYVKLAPTTGETFVSFVLSGTATATLTSTIVVKLRGALFGTH